MGPEVQRAAAGALDVRRRRGAADPARASPAATRPTAASINHALRITVPTTQKAYIHPATHWASSNTDPDQPPMGLRVRLKASYDISGLRGQAKVVAQALKTYGALVADNAGSPRVYVSRRQRPRLERRGPQRHQADPGERAGGRRDEPGRPRRVSAGVPTRSTVSIAGHRRSFA